MTAHMLVYREDPHCVYCGKQLLPTQKTTLTCSRRCNMRRWRSIKKLEGTHGMYEGQFKRLPVAT